MQLSPYFCYSYSYNYNYIFHKPIQLHNIIFISVGNQQHQIVKDRVGKQTKVLKNLPTAEPNVQIKSLSDNPDNKEFLGFQIVDTKSKKELFRFRAKDIVECRKFMVSLGDTGDGLFTKK